ncbi:hypothetical protein [Corallococcus carmarthensis]|uniref:Lipoprotein n=1 Tax=Corallococcus carmarthensis TaxID=2316728 RepID=A0A3A8JIA5_9BACT|nr:hypothetical protein [Corallococcus carmarthensis]RKG95467.1 hypothetical protein D7X32_38995 [Corallococcus carmarthensis]
MASSVLRVPWCFLLLALSGCEPALPDSTDVSPGADVALGTSESDIRIANSLRTQELVVNAIAANHDANEALSTNSLESLFDPDEIIAGPQSDLIRNQLRDPYAQRFMAYLVGCALGEGETLEWLNPLQPGSSQRSEWAGSAGLCPWWRTEAPGDACLKRVTACLLARNNGLGYRVELSMRGELHEPALSIAEPFALDAWTTPIDQLPTAPAPLSSAVPCDTRTVGAGRDCGWTMHSVGWCPAGQTIAVGAGGPQSCPSGTPLGSSSGARMALRVCHGIAGCDSTDDVRHVASSQGCSPGSTNPLPSASTDPSVRFTCPATGGYFTVMTAPWDSSAEGTANVGVTTGVQAPLSERAVYRIREGAFYGNLFGRDALRDDINVTVTLVSKNPDRYAIKRPRSPQVKPIFKDLYACYDPGWVYGMAYATYRVCALPGTNEDCAAQVTGPCWDSNPLAAHRCEQQDGPLLGGDGDFERCRDLSNTLWTEPVTVYLNGACDLVDEQHRDLCKRWTEPPPPQDVSRGTGKK